MKALTRIVLFCFLFMLMPFPSCAQVDGGEGGYTYFGYIPAKIWYAEPTQLGHATPTSENFTINPLTVAESALIAVVAYSDETDVKVYTLPNKELAEGEVINRMEKLFVKLPNGTFFKVHASKPVTVGLLGGNVGTEELDPGMREGPIPTCFYTCADGTYVGKEFIFIACQGLTGLQYRILALEESEVIVYKEDGTSQSFMLKANEYKDLSFTAFKAYKVASTGNVMVQSSYGYIPSVEGGYTGASFYTKSTTSWYGYIAYGFQIIAAEEAKVTVYDVEFKRRIDEFVVPAQRNVTIKPKSNEIFIESDRPISVVYVSHGSPANYGASGLNYMGVSPDETAYVYIPLSSSQESYVFAYRDETVVTIGGAPIKLDADEFVPLSPGLHEVKTTENVLIQIVYSSNFPEIQSIRSFGTVVPAIETLDVRKDIELQPILEEETSMTTYIYASVAAAVIIAAAATYYLKSHK